MLWKLVLRSFSLAVRISTCLPSRIGVGFRDWSLAPASRSGTARGFANEPQAVLLKRRVSSGTFHHPPPDVGPCRHLLFTLQPRGVFHIPRRRSQPTRKRR